MKFKHFDLIVIGSGPAGEKGAAQAAYFGKKVAIIEKKDFLGGVMANSAVPGKGLRETSLVISGFNQRELHGVRLSREENLNVGQVLHRSVAMRETLVDAVEQNLDKHGVEVFHGSAAFRDAQSVTVTDAAGNEIVLGADFFLIGTGSQPIRPAQFPFGAANVFDSDSIFSMGKLPASIIIVGAGTIGTEYACIFSQLGTKVTIVNRAPGLLPFVDAEISARLKTAMEAEGIEFFLSEDVLSLTSNEMTTHTKLKSGREITADAAFISVGRKSNVAALNLDKIGVEFSERGTIQVNDNYQTSVDHIYAAGDVVGFPALASTSMEQARIAMVDAFKLKYKGKATPLLPYGVWTIPEISVVGQTEEALKEKGIPYVVGRAEYSSNSRGMVIGEKDGLLKLIFSVPEHRLIGVHIVGEQACELISPGMIAITMGAGFDTFIETCFNFPSLAEMYKYATYDAMNNLKKEQPKDI